MGNEWLIYVSLLCLRVLCPFILSVVCGHLVAAHRALVVLFKPLWDAALVKKVTAGHLCRLICQILTADRATREFLFLLSCCLAIWVCYLNLFQILYWLFTSWRSACATSFLLGKTHNVRKNCLVRGKRAEIEVKVSKKWRRERISHEN